MDENDLKRLLEGAMAETRRHFDVVAERTDRKIETIAEAGTASRGEAGGVGERPKAVAKAPALQSRPPRGHGRARMLQLF